MIKRFVRLPEVCHRVGLPKSTLYRLMAEGEFPRPIKISERTSAWLDEEIDAWQQGRIVASRKVVA